MVETRSASHIVSHDSSVTDSNPERTASRAGDYPDEEDSNPEPTARRVKRTRKRPRKSADDTKPSKTPRRRRGRLDLMPTMNLDILFHILSFCYPMDLLNLSRTTKDFRNLLLQPSSANAWKTARLQVEGLPDCPSDMSEPQYANLVFYPHCHDCDRVVRNVSWALRVRYCSECFASNTVDEYDRRLQDVRFTSFGFHRYLPSVTLLERGRRKSLFLRKALEELILEHSEMPEDQKVAFLDKKRKHAGDVMRHAEQCLLWMESVASSRKHELDDLRHDRRDAIIARLTEAGYKPELDYIGISWLQKKEKAAFRAKSLTTKEWDRICPDLTRRLDAVRVARLEDKIYGPRREILMAEYKKYLQQPPPPGAAFDVMPHATDVAEFDPFRDIIMSPESTIITASSFVSAFQQLPDFVPSWRVKIDREFVDQIRFPENYGDSEEQNNLDVLQLATAVFTVWRGNDRRLLTYPEVLLWPGFFAPSGHASDLHNWMDTSVLRMDQFGCWTWSASRRSLFSNTISVFGGTAAVVRSAGFDPKTARLQDMERLNARFACGLCSSSGKKVVMNWEMAILHSYRMHQALQEETEWTLIEGDELANVKNYEHEAKHALSDSAIVYCALCQHHIGDAQSLRCTRDHLATIHGIDKAERGTHYIPDRNSISVIAMMLDRDGKVSNHVSNYQVESFSSGVEILRQHSHTVYP